MTKSSQKKNPPSLVLFVFLFANIGRLKITELLFLPGIE